MKQILLLGVAAAAAAFAQSTPIPGRLLVKFHKGVGNDRAAAVLAAHGARTAERIAGADVHIVELPPQASEVALRNRLKAQGEVEFAEQDFRVAPGAITPNDPGFSSQWFLTKIAAPTAWSTTTGSSGIIIAILDTGVDGTHEDLASKMIAGRNIYDNNTNTADVYGHGTRVAGTAAGASNNSIGTASVAWNCWIMPIRISDAGGYANVSTAASGLTWAADHGARVANISYMMSNSATVQAAADYFQSKGGVVTISAGNYSTVDLTPDAPSILTISGSDPNDSLYSWSNRGNNIDLAAPGCVYVPQRGGGYASDCGTSFASPVVAGVAALVLSVNPSLTAAQVQTILKQSADDRGSAGFDQNYGWGRVNAANAVALAASGGGADTQAPTVGITTPADGSTVSSYATVSATAGDNVGVTSVTVSIDGVTKCTMTVFPYNCSWNTTGTPNGPHAVTATARDGAGNTSSRTHTVTTNNVVDSSAPSIAITSPSAGASIPVNVTVTVNASDNVGVSRVDLYVDGALTATSTAAPFTTKWSAKKASRGGHTLQTKATDTAGNTAWSASIVVYK